MNTNLKLPVLALAAVLSLHAAAQKTENKEKKKEQTVTIIRSGDSDEKITVEVSGDKVTINGKPASEFKGGNVEVITGDNTHVRALRPTRVWAPKVPGVPGGDMFVIGGSNKAVLGVSMEDGEGGAKVTEVTKESAAEKAGLREGDVITKVNDMNVADADDLPAALSKYKPEDKVTITYKRDGKEATATATLDKPRHSSMANTFMTGDHDFNFDFGDRARVYNFSGKPRLGIQIEDLQEGEGARVLDVDSETPAAKAGLQKDDIITSFNGKNVKDVNDLRDAMKEVKEGEAVKLSYKRAGAVQNTEIKFPKRVKKASL